MHTSTCRRVAVAISLVALLSLAGCSSSNETDRPTPPVAETRDLPPTMAGTENFADGKITVKVTLALPGYYHGGKEADQPDGSSHHGGGGGGRHHGGQGGGDAPSTPAGESSDDAGPHLSGSNLPPAQLKISLQNNSANESAKCEVTDFNSSLGDFAVFPSRYEIEAGQSASSEAMTSRLGVEGSEIAVTVGLQVDGHSESKVVTLRLLKPAEEPAKATTP